MTYNNTSKNKNMTQKGNVRKYKGPKIKKLKDIKIRREVLEIFEEDRRQAGKAIHLNPYCYYEEQLDRIIKYFEEQ